nr:DUF5959 family protein [Streptomyces virginiae]
MGRRSPGLPHLHDQLDAEVLVTSSFIAGRLAMTLVPSDLEAWSRALDALAAGQNICWRDDDHSPEIRIEPHDEEHECVAVRIEDLGQSCVSVVLPVGLEEDGSTGREASSTSCASSGRARSWSPRRASTRGGAERAAKRRRRRSVCMRLRVWGRRERR